MKTMVAITIGPFNLSLNMVYSLIFPNLNQTKFCAIK